MPYPDDYRASGAPDRFVSAAQQRREDAQGVAGDIYEEAVILLAEASRLMDDAAEDWSLPARWTVRETSELMRRMNDIACVLRDLREGRMPGEKGEKANDR